MSSKPRHISKKTKASWRRTDITDVETFLEEQREDERIGTVADKSDAELFLNDSVQRPEKKSSLKQLRKKQFTQEPKFCTALKNTSRVADPIAKRNIVTNEEKLLALKKKKDKRLPKNVRVNIKKKTVDFNKDIWAEEPVSSELTNEWFNDNVVLHHLKNTGKPLVKVAASTHTKPNAIPNIELPVSGASYNPAIDDYNELKDKVIEAERAIIRREQHLDRVVTQKFTKMSNQVREEMVMKEMSEGLFENKESKHAEAEEDDDEEYAALNPAVVNKKKDRRARNKQFRAVSRQLAEKEANMKLKKIKDINRIPEMKAEILKENRKKAKKQENRAKRLEEKKLKPGRVAYLEYKAPEEDFVEYTDLADSLRTLMPNKSLLADRFNSFQKRTVIAPKKHKDGKQRKTRAPIRKWKRYTLNSHKE